jgi:hypothetical protein
MWKSFQFLCFSRFEAQSLERHRSYKMISLISNKNLILNITLIYTSLFLKQKAVALNKNQIPFTVQQSESHTTGSISVISLIHQSQHFSSGVKQKCKNIILQGLKFNCQKYAWKIQLVDPVDCNPCSSIRMLKTEDILDESIVCTQQLKKKTNIQKHIQPMKYVNRSQT